MMVSVNKTALFEPVKRHKSVEVIPDLHSRPEHIEKEQS
jgi:hypothetical protein